MFRLEKGIAGQVRRRGESWKPFTTTREQTFPDKDVFEYDMLAILSKGEWEFRVLRKLIVHVLQHNNPVEYTSRYGTFNRSVLGRNGKGASKRAKQRKRRCGKKR